jgi:membrane protein DedA with SNARE-associated domain
MSDLSAGTWVSHCAGLFFLTFAHEDAAIVAAAYARVEYGLPLGLAFLSVYSGVVAGDFFIYGLGRAAHKNAWLRARIIGPRVEQARLWMDTHLIRLVALCRITPGLLFPSFVACGWFRLPFWRFALITFVSATVYTPLAMALAILLGENVLHRLGHWAWAMPLLFILAFALRGILRPPWKHLTGHLPAHHQTPILEVLHRRWPGLRRHHQGMPTLERLSRLVARAERIPTFLFYLPVVLRWFWLALRYRSLTLPTVANPMIETGGFWGESKSACMDQVGEAQRCWLAEFVTLERGDADAVKELHCALRLMDGAGLGFPVVAKPDIGWQGYGVRLVADAEQLHQYLAAFPSGERLLVQRPVLHDGEAGVFYARLPGEDRGQVFSLTLRYFPYVIGDGRSSLRELVLRDTRAGWKARYHLGRHPEHLGLGRQDLERVPADSELVRLAFIGSIRVGGLYRDMRQFITPALSRRFDAIARSMPEFYFGRFDIRFESLERLQSGEGFSIIEINGAGSEAIHIWDPEVPLCRVYRELFQAQDLMFDIAARNRARGFRPVGLVAFLGMAIHQHRLLGRYPPSG